MDIDDLKLCYYIRQEDVLKLENLGLLNNIPIVDGKRKFDDESVNQMIEMINLMKLGLDDKSLVNYYRKTEMQIDILRKIRIPILEQLHYYQKKLDDIDYMIYEKKNQSEEHKR